MTKKLKKLNLTNRNFLEDVSTTKSPCTRSQRLSRRLCTIRQSKIIQLRILPEDRFIMFHQILLRILPQIQRLVQQPIRRLRRLLQRCIPRHSRRGNHTRSGQLRSRPPCQVTSQLPTRLHCPPVYHHTNLRRCQPPIRLRSPLPSRLVIQQSHPLLSRHCLLHRIQRRDLPPIRHQDLRTDHHLCLLSSLRQDLQRPDLLQDLRPVLTTGPHHNPPRNPSQMAMTPQTTLRFPVRQTLRQVVRHVVRHEIRHAVRLEVQQSPQLTAT